MHQQLKCEEYLPLFYFSYNNVYHKSLKMSLFETFYEWSCNTPINWSDLMTNVLIGPDMLAEMEQDTSSIKINLNTTHERKKSNGDQNMVFKEFQGGELVYLCIRPKRIPLRIIAYEKLTLQYCKYLEILERIGLVYY